MKKIIFALSIITLGCNTTKEKGMSNDTHTFSSKSDVRVEHLSLDINVNFESKIIEGIAKYSINKNHSDDTIHLDIKGISIIDVVNSVTNEKLNYAILEKDKVKGEDLAINVKDVNSISIQYKTSNDAAALQWLNAEQTADKKHPFLYTQSQAILARTWIPCQDGPGVRFTYDARVKVPTELMALMSAENPVAKNDSGIYHFKQKRAIPSYLMALAVGDLAFQELGRNSGVYTEPGQLKKCAEEFSDLPKMMDAAEALYGKYQWARYDVLVLPPSFPFGGMENPEVTFATPTIIAGDKSLVSLLAHELAHSWSGNLVTNDTWNDFWLNEGFTTYFERRIMESIEGKEYADMLKVLGYQDLQEELNAFGENHADTRLRLDLINRDPDEGLTDIAYEKGSLFLVHIENTIGREKFDAFLKNYFTSNAFKTMNTDQFLKILNDELIKNDKAIAEKINAIEWIDSTGLPSVIPIIQSSRLVFVDSALVNFKNQKSISSIDTKNWSSHEWLYFIRGLGEKLDATQMNDLKKNVNFAKSGNAELEAAWYLHVLRNNFTEDYIYVDAFLQKVGRRKFLMPLYAEMIKTEAGKKMAKDIYNKARKNYHYVSTQSLDELLK